MMGIGMAVRPPRSRGPVLMMISALRRLGGTLIYAPDNLSGVYVDNVGTTPVTAAADLFGLITDKSYGGRLGPNLCPNGTFDNGATGWTVPAGWAVGSGVAAATATSSSLKQQGTPLAALKTYQVEFDATIASGTLVVRVGDGSPAQFTAVGSSRRRAVLVAANANGVEFYGGAVTGSVGKVVVQELTGNHATQSAVASKPSFQRVNGRNVISFDGSNDFLQTGITTGNEGWVCAGVTFGGAAGALETVFCSGAVSDAQKGVWLFRNGGLGNVLQLTIGNGTARTFLTTAVGGALVGNSRVVEAGWSTSNAMKAVDGVEATSSRTGDASPSQSPATIGSSTTGGAFLLAPMHAIAYTPVLPSAADRATIRNGIAALQGRTL